MTSEPVQQHHSSSHPVPPHHIANSHTSPLPFDIGYQFDSTTQGPQTLRSSDPTMTDTVQAKFGQITPPEEHWKNTWNTDEAPLNEEHFMTSRDRKSSSESSSALGITTGRVDKKDKYREKNRVAAAKCRAKKKEHVDGLEENHRTQSMLNALLKQTEQNLRDELSFWRTQALQHAFCDCSAVQEYNMKKARALAADKHFGGEDLHRRDSIAHSPSSSSKAGVNFYQQPQPEFDANPS